ncbi:MAG: DUF2201 family putative metallopeptidase [Acidobacteriota bacterium]
MIDRNKFFDAFPAGNYAISGWLRLMAFQESREVETAAIQTRQGHAILVNPDFVARYAHTPERQVTLVLHELMHLLLGHQLRPVTKLDNFVFDAVINAMLCRILRDRAYWSLFTSYYSANKFPECLLRPPRHFEPGRPVLSPRRLSGPAFARLRAIYRDLYGEYGATYTDLREELMKCASSQLHLDGLYRFPPETGEGLNNSGSRPQPAGGRQGQGEGQESGEGTSRELESWEGAWEESPSVYAPLTGVPLLGNHPVGECCSAKVDFYWLRCMEVVLHSLVDAARGRSPYGRETTFTLPPHPARERENTIRVTRLIEKVAREGHVRARKFYEDRIRATTVLPALDRKSNILRFLGLQPLLYAWEVPVRARFGIEKVHLYVDVSGSVFDYIPSFFLAVLGCRDLVQPEVHQFSTVVAEAKWEELHRGKVKTSGGTDINCVLEHMLRHRIRRAVILTDGEVGAPRSEFTRLLEESVIGVALTPHGYKYYLERHVRHWEQLQALGGAQVTMEPDD